MKWGIMGTGRIAGTFAGTVLKMNTERETLAAAGSRSEDSARAFAEKYCIPRAHSSYEALVNDPEIDAVYIATPNSLHYENALLCLNAGQPAVIFGDQGKIVLPDYQHCQEFTVVTWDGGEEKYLFPFEASGFEYEIRAFTEAASKGAVVTEDYSPEASLDILRALDRIRASWGLRFTFEQ